MATIGLLGRHAMATEIPTREVLHDCRMDHHDMPYYSPTALRPAALDGRVLQNIEVACERITGIFSADLRVAMGRLPPEG